MYRNKLVRALSCVLALSACSETPLERRERSSAESPTATDAGVRDATRALAASRVNAATLEQYWNGQAHFEMRTFMADDEYGRQAGAGSGVVVGKNGDWFMFNRRVLNKPGCNGGGYATDVRRLNKKSGKWSEPRLIVGAEDGKPWHCGATDGDLAYDPENNQWHFLFQCLNKRNKWSGCYLTAYGENLYEIPASAWRPANGNRGRVLKSGDLWSRICNEALYDPVGASGPHCVRAWKGFAQQQAQLGEPVTFYRVNEEGTFSFVHQPVNARGNATYRTNDFFMVTFHGYDGVSGYRGLAKTNDFKNWIAGDPAQGVPDDAIADPLTIASWRISWQGLLHPVTRHSIPGSAGYNAGAGGGFIFREGGLFYMFVEGADQSVTCTVGQNWAIGLYRVGDLRLPSKRWEPLPRGNPILRKDRANAGADGEEPCNPSYPYVWSDIDGTIYMKFAKFGGAAAGVYIYKLVPGAADPDNTRQF